MVTDSKIFLLAAPLPQKVIFSCRIKRESLYNGRYRENQLQTTWGCCFSMPTKTMISTYTLLAEGQKIRQTLMLTRTLSSRTMAREIFNTRPLLCKIQKRAVLALLPVIMITMEILICLLAAGFYRAV